MKELFHKSFGNKNKANQQSLKLQNYTIRKFNGNYKDWLRFWSQFTVKVDNCNISNISKFSYLLELVEGKPREGILGLPHWMDKMKQNVYYKTLIILQDTYGKDNWVHKVLIKDLEGIRTIH